jgi:hypothetical protein
MVTERYRPPLLVLALRQRHQSRRLEDSAMSTIHYRLMLGIGHIVPAYRRVDVEVEAMFQSRHRQLACAFGLG